MTPDAQRPHTLLADDITTGGSYFVSNYPPFSSWLPERVDEARQALAAPPAPGTPLGLYLHIPFCRRRCHFCYFKVYTDKNSSEIRRYIDGLVAEMTLYARMPFIGGRRPQFVYFGGGTPSYLSPSQLQELFGRLRAELSWDGAEEITFECEPGTLNEAKLRVLRDLGVTRLSLGVENFDDAILETNGRAHHAPEIARAYGYARSIGFPQINIDLIAGMIGETDENWRRNIERAIELEPDSITIYQMEIPFNTTIYHRMKDEGKISAPVADWPTKRRWVGEAFAALEAAGYEISSAYTAVRKPASGAGANGAAASRFVYRDSLWTGADLLALGVASFSHLGGVHFQNEKELEPWLERVTLGEPPIYRALRASPEERLIRMLVLQLKLGHVSRAWFRERFGVELAERFAEPIAQLTAGGLMRSNGDRLELTREGLLRADRLLHLFFLPEHREPATPAGVAEPLPERARDGRATED